MIITVTNVATVLTACGIETCEFGLNQCIVVFADVATVLTACGIETILNNGEKIHNPRSCNSTYRLRY